MAKSAASSIFVVGEKDYIGNVDVAGKTVLEIGTASGHLCFWMESQGARMVAYDLSENHDWDIVPYSKLDFTEYVRERKAHVRSINNSWWFARERFKSKARMAYGTVYDLRETLGHFDVVTMGSLLLHLRDPFLAMQKAASLALDTMVITDFALPPREQALAFFSKGRVVRFLPNAETAEPWETWWQLSPNFIVEALAILGFTEITTSTHRQAYRGKDLDLYTIVGRKRATAAPRQERESTRRDGVDDYGFHDTILRAIPARHVLKHLVGRVRKRLRVDS